MDSEGEIDRYEREIDGYEREKSRKREILRESFSLSSSDEIGPAAVVFGN